MKSMIAEYGVDFLNAATKNETFGSILMGSMKIVKLFDTPNFAFYMLSCCVLFLLFLLFYTGRQLRAGNYIYSFFLILPIVLSGAACGVTGWTIHSSQQSFQFTSLAGHFDKTLTLASK